MKKRCLVIIRNILLLSLTLVFLLELPYGFRIGIRQRYSDFVPEITGEAEIDGGFLYGRVKLEKPEEWAAFYGIMDQTEYRLIPLYFLTALMPKTGGSGYSYMPDERTTVYIYPDRIQVHKMDRSGERVIFILDYVPADRAEAHRVYEELRVKLPMIPGGNEGNAE